MFVIADNTHKFPSYLRSVLSNGFATTTVSMNDTKIYTYRKDAEEILRTITDSANFNFKIHELTIKQ